MKIIKLINVSNPIKETKIPSFDILYQSINKEKIEIGKKETEEKESNIKTQKEYTFDSDNKRINELLSGYVTEEDLVYVKNIISKYINNKKDLCLLRFRYITKYKVDFYEEISDVTMLIDLKREILNIIDNAKCRKIFIKNEKIV